MDTLEIKRKAVQYYNDNQIPQQLEKLLNSMFHKQPPDMYGYMVSEQGKC